MESTWYIDYVLRFNEARKKEKMTQSKNKKTKKENLKKIYQRHEILNVKKQMR